MTASLLATKNPNFLCHSKVGHALLLLSGSRDGKIKMHCILGYFSYPALAKFL